MTQSTGHRKQMLALAFVVLLAILLRYPRFPNEFSGDTLELHWNADAIRDDGFVGFMFSPLSWFGVYPVSYPMGVPILGAFVADLSGLPTDAAIDAVALMIGVLGVLGYFVLAHRLSGNFGVALICAAALATSGFHVSQTVGGLSGRATLQSL